MDWATIRSNAFQHFAELVPGSKLTDGLIPYAGPIDWAWGTTTFVSDTLGKARLLYLQNCNQVEFLVGEAGALIERCLGDMSKYDELNVDSFKTIVEFIEYDKIKTQQTSEQADVPFWAGLTQEAALAAAARQHAHDSSATINQLLAGSRARYGEAVSDAGTNDVARQNAAGAREAAGAAASEYSDQTIAETSETQSHSARASYEDRSRVHQVERQNITQDIVGLKLNEMQKHLGALNYKERMDAISARVLDDFSETFARMNAISLGLREFYSITGVPDIDATLQTARTRVDGAVNWLRLATNMLARARMDEQHCSLRLTVADSSLRENLKQGVVISFPDSRVATLGNARLQGVSATAEFPTGDSDRRRDSFPRAKATICGYYPTRSDCSDR